MATAFCFHAALLSPHALRPSLSLRCRGCRLLAPRAMTPAVGGGAGPAVVWFKHDLRIDDHPGLVDAVERHSTVVPLYVFDRRILSDYSDEMLEQLLFALEDLKLLLADKGSDLLVSFGSAEDVILKLVNQVKATHIFAEEEADFNICRVISLVESSISHVSFSWGGPKFVFWRTPFYDVKNLKELPASNRDFLKLQLPVTVPLAAPSLPRWNMELDSGGLPTFRNLKIFLNAKLSQSQECWISLKKIPAKSKLRKESVINEESSKRTFLTHDETRKVAKSVFASPKSNQVSGRTYVVLNALAAYLRYLEGTARDDWQE